MVLFLIVKAEAIFGWMLKHSASSLLLKGSLFIEAKEVCGMHEVCVVVLMQLQTNEGKGDKG